MRRIIPYEQSAHGMSHENHWRMDVRGSKQSVEIRGNVIGVAWRWTGITPPRTRSIVGTDLRMQSQFGLDAYPGHAIVSASGFQHNCRRAPSHALHSHQ